jgi:chromosomal replication initiator protein
MVSYMAIPGTDCEALVGAKIEKVVCAHYGVTPEWIRGKRLRSDKVSRVMVRQAIMAMQREQTKLSLAEIGAAFGKDHATALHACKSIERRRNQKAFAKGWEELKRKCGFEG